MGDHSATPATVPGRIAAGVAELVGEPVDAVQPLSGGDVAQAFRVDLVSGTPLFAKTHSDPPPGLFVTEALGLKSLVDTGAVRVPEVVAVTDGAGSAGPGSAPLAMLVLQWVDHTRGAAPDEQAFGAELAAMHQTGFPCFGRPDQRPTGSRQLPTTPSVSWAEFYAGCRLLPLSRMASNSQSLDPATIARVEQVAAQLERFGAADEPPALIHGDLWAGNRLVDRWGASWLVDPAVHGGHREFDLAMMDLFGGFSPDVFAAYNDVHPLADGWQQRVPLHQLAPLMVHAIKFGGSYRQATSAAVQSLL